MDKQIDQLNKLSNISDFDKVIIQQSGGGTLNTTVGELSNLIINKMRAVYDITKEEIIYDFGNKTEKPFANFDIDVVLPNLTDWTKYQYVEIYCRTDDGYIVSAKIHDPQIGKRISLAAGNIGNSLYFFMKTRIYELTSTGFTTVKNSEGNYMSGTWFYNANTSDHNKAKVEHNIGVAKIVGYK